MKPTIVLGASTNPSRYSHIACLRLLEYGHKVFPVGIKKGKIQEMEILNDKPIIKEIDTVTLYLNPDNQKEWYKYIFKINPKRLIFNPGTENLELQYLAQEKGIQTVEACTLVMLSIGNY
jgi:predicted CoA-binding protein